MMNSKMELMINPAVNAVESEKKQIVKAFLKPRKRKIQELRNIREHIIIRKIKIPLIPNIWSKLSTILSINFKLYFILFFK